MGFDMHIRLTCDISQEQIDCGYDLTLLAIHTRFVEWLVGLEIPIVGFSILWEEGQDGTSHLFANAELVQDSSVEIDEQFFDKMHLGSDGDE
jgi:hypothetical protein